MIATGLNTEHREVILDNDQRVVLSDEQIAALYLAVLTDQVFAKDTP